MQTEKIDQVRQQTITRSNPLQSGDLIIEILHVNVHPTKEGSITWTYSDDSSETITMHGNGRTKFKNKTGEWTDFIVTTGDHTATIANHSELTKVYMFEKVDRQAGYNSWRFRTKSGGVTSVEISNPVESWGGFYNIDLKWSPHEEVREVRQCCRALNRSCLACSAGLSVEEYCNRHPGQHGCPGSTCHPQTGPSSGSCPTPRCTKCPDGKTCTNVLEYRANGDGTCCPIPCNRIETDMPCPNAGRGWGACAPETRPVDTDDFTYERLPPNWVKSGASCCNVQQWKQVKKNEICCKAMTRECLACQAGITVDEFCSNPIHSVYCTGFSSTSTSVPQSSSYPSSSENDSQGKTIDNAENYPFERVVIDNTEEDGGIPMPSQTAIIAAIIVLAMIILLVAMW